MSPDSSLLIKTLKPTVWSNSSPSRGFDWQQDSDLFRHLSGEDEAHFGSAYFSPLCAQGPQNDLTDHLLEDLHHWWSGVPSLPRLWGRIHPCAIGLRSTSLADPSTEGSRVQAKVWTARYAVPEMWATVTSLRAPSRSRHSSSSNHFPRSSGCICSCSCFLAAFFSLASGPALQFLATSYYAPAPSWKVPCPVLSHYCRLFLFFPSPPVILRSSLVLEDVMSSEVFMFVEIYKQMSWGNAVCGYSRTGARKLLCLRCEIIYIKKKSLQKLPGRLDFGLQGWTSGPPRSRTFCTHQVITSCHLTAAILPNCTSYRFQAPSV